MDPVRRIATSKMIRVQPTYEKSSSPELSKELMEAIPIFVLTKNLLNFDFIDTVRKAFIK